MPSAKPESIYYVDSSAEFKGKFTEKVTSRIAFQKKLHLLKCLYCLVQSLFENVLILSCL